MAEEGRILKPDEDFSAKVDAELPAIRALPLAQALERLTALEKQTRQASDALSTKRILIAVVQLCAEHGAWEQLNDEILGFSKKHGQLKAAAQGMVAEAWGLLQSVDWVGKGLTKERGELIETLRVVTEGKVFVEVERARVTRLLTQILENSQPPQISEAAKTLCELQIETFGSMSRGEKTDFLLEQVRLCIAAKDWLTAENMGRKISTRWFDSKDGDDSTSATTDEDTPKYNKIDLKLRYYDLMVRLSLHQDDYLATTKHYLAVYHTLVAREETLQARAILQNVLIFVILSPYGNEQSDLLARVVREDPVKNGQMDWVGKFVQSFTHGEILRWPAVQNVYGTKLRGTDIFAIDKGDGKGQLRWETLAKRVTEHNVRVIAKSFTRIRMDRLTTFLDLSEEESEKYLSEMVTSGAIYARIDRPAKTISFDKPKDGNDVLNEWSGNIHDLLGLCEKLGHLITKEEMMNAAARPQRVR